MDEIDGKEDDVHIPVVQYGGDYEDDFSDVASDRYSDDDDPENETEHTKKQKKEIQKGIHHYGKDDSVEKDESDEETKKKKKKIHKAYGIDLTPPDQLLKDARKQGLVVHPKHGESREAVHELVRAVALSRIVYGDGHWQLAKAYVDLATAYSDLLGYAPQAAEHAETANKILNSTVHAAKSDQDHSKIFEVHMNANYILGRALAMQKKFAASEKSLQKCGTLHRKWVKSHIPSKYDDEMEAKIAIALAKVNLINEKHANAANEYEKALEILESMHGQTSKKLIPVYQGLGKVELAKGNLANAEHAINMYETAHKISSSHYGSGEVEVAETGRALANAYSQIGGPAAETSAESYLNECIVVYLSIHGPNHKTTIEVKDELAKLMMRTERLSDGLKETKSNIGPKKEVYGEFSEEVSNTHKLIANIHLALGSMDQALKSYKNCYNIDKVLYGENHKRCKDIQANIDKLLANPRLAATLPKSTQDQLKERPRFNGIVNKKDILTSSDRMVKGKKES